MSNGAGAEASPNGSALRMLTENLGELLPQGEIVNVPPYLLAHAITRLEFAAFRHMWDVNPPDPELWLGKYLNGDIAPMGKVRTHVLPPSNARDRQSPTLPSAQMSRSEEGMAAYLQDVNIKLRLTEGACPHVSAASMPACVPIDRF